MFAGQQQAIAFFVQPAQAAIGTRNCQILICAIIGE
jgi:hypothetical protein